jgi:hypothetical protein
VYEEPAALGVDVAAALAAGIERVEIYSLDGMVEDGEVGLWLDGTNTMPAEPTISAGVRFVRSLAANFDREFDSTHE